MRIPCKNKRNKCHSKSFAFCLPQTLRICQNEASQTVRSLQPSIFIFSINWGYVTLRIHSMIGTDLTQKIHQNSGKQIRIPEQFNDAALKKSEKYSKRLEKNNKTLLSKVILLKGQFFSMINQKNLLNIVFPHIHCTDHCA